MSLFTDRTYYHWALMLQESNTAIGCAVSVHQEDPWKFVYILTCNYAANNRLGCPIYNEGSPPGNACTNGVDSVLPALCNVTEPIDPNQSPCDAVFD